MLSLKVLLLLDFIFCSNASARDTFQRPESSHSNIVELLQHRVEANAKEAERPSGGVPGGSSRPAELHLHFSTRRFLERGRRAGLRSGLCLAQTCSTNEQVHNLQHLNARKSDMSQLRLTHVKKKAIN